MALRLRPQALAALATLASGAQAAPLLPTLNCGGDQPLAWGGSLVGQQPSFSYLFDGVLSDEIQLGCTDAGAFAPLQVSARKSGEGQKDFLIVKLKEVFITSLVNDPPKGLQSVEDIHIKLGVRSVFHKFDDAGIPIYDNFFELTQDVFDIAQKDFTTPLASIFLSHKWRTAHKFDGLVSYKFDEELQTLSMQFELQEFEAEFAFAAAAPVALPGTLTLLGAGLAGAGLSLRRRRGW